MFICLKIRASASYKPCTLLKIAINTAGNFEYSPDASRKRLDDVVWAAVSGKLFTMTLLETGIYRGTTGCTALIKNYQGLLVC